MSRLYVFSDNYEHCQNDVIYTAVNIPGPGSSAEDFNVQYERGCDCTDGNCSLVADCPCVARYGINYTSDGLLRDEKRNGPVVECNSECSCRDNGLCLNRVVQFGPRDDLEVFVADNDKGYGVKSKSLVRKGSFVCEYAGEVISVDEAKRRTSASRSMNYVFVLNEFVGESKVIRTCVDPGGIGNVGRYLNHSCEPNCAIVAVRVDCPVPKLGIFSIVDVDVGEELTFDYGGGGREVGATTNRKACRCAARNCRLFLPFDEDLV